MKYLLLSIMVLLLVTGCGTLSSSFSPANVIETLAEQGCTVHKYHQNGRKQVIDIECEEE